MGLFWACVQQQSVQVVETCGAFSRVIGPGFHPIWCCIGECVSGGLNLRVQQLDVRVETKSSDDVFLLIVVSIQYQYDPDNAYNAFYKLSNLREQLSAYVFDVVRATVPKLPLSEVFTMKARKGEIFRGVVVLALLAGGLAPSSLKKKSKKKMKSKNRTKSPGPSKRSSQSR